MCFQQYENLTDSTVKAKSVTSHCSGNRMDGPLLGNSNMRKRCKLTCINESTTIFIAWIENYCIIQTIVKWLWDILYTLFM